MARIQVHTLVCPQITGLPILLATLIFSVSLADFSFAAQPQPPNILWLSCEDISPHIGCFDDPHAITPNLDRLAGQGTRFTHVFTAAGVCAPCRSTIITGMYQNSIGTHHMRCNATLPEWLKPFPMLLREQGYFCTNNSKTDYQFSQPSKDQIWDECSSKADWQHREAGQPFFAVFNYTGCHESGIAGTEKYKSVTSVLKDSQRQDPAAFTNLPPYYPDTPIVREDWKRNYELITAMDVWAGEHIQRLSDAGELENTIIVFWSDHGVGLPRAKRWLYDSGTRVPFIIRIPEGLRQEIALPVGGISDALVSSVDFGPTVLSLAGIEVPETMQGQAFLGAYAAPARKYVYGARDRMDERYDAIRAVRDDRFRYIRNYEPLKPYYQYMNTPEKGATMREIREAEHNGTLSPIAVQFSTGSKPVEELYDTVADPHEVHNLAADPRYAERLRTMRTECLRWQSDIRDLGLVPESEIEFRTRQAGSTFAILRGTGQDSLGERLVAIAAAASDGPEAIPSLLKALNDPDAAVRFWGATGLGNIGEPAKAAAQTQLLAHVHDDSAAVRIAIGRALCRMGNPQAGLPLLQNGLRSDLEWARLEAAIALDELDEVARPALADLQAALVKQPNKYIVRVANKALNDLLGTQAQVP